MTALLKLIHSGKNSWNAWRVSNPSEKLELTRYKLRHTALHEYDLSGVILYRADLEGADLCKANLRGSNLRHAQFQNAVAVRANISRAICWKTNFQNANLHMVDFWGSDLSDAVMQNAQMMEARLHGSIMVRADLRNANLSKAMVYGSSTWDALLDGATQRDLVITPDAGRQKWHGYDRMEVAGPVMTVDDLEVAQFIYLLVNNSKVRKVIETITSKIVLILGRFSPERKCVLDCLRDELRKHDLVPVLFDFEKPLQRDFTETIKTLAGLSHFIIVVSGSFLHCR